MTVPGLGGMVPPGEDDLPRRLRALEAQVAALASARSLEAATIGRGGLTVASGGTLHVTGATIIDGTLSLPAGIIDNDALTSPANFAVANGASSGIAFGVTQVTMAADTLTVPSGYSRALVMMTASVGGTSPAGGGNLYGFPRIAGVAGDQIAQAAGGGSYATSQNCSFARLLTGLNGGTIAVDVRGFGSAAGWTGGNGHVSAIAIFLR